VSCAFMTLISVMCDVEKY